MIELTWAAAPLTADFIKDFHQVAASVYEDDSIWVSQSEDLVNPFTCCDYELPMDHASFLLARIDDVSIGRALVLLPSIPNRSNQSLQGWIGFFEILPDQTDHASVILNACVETLQFWGAKKIIALKTGNQFVGIQTAGFDWPQTVLTPHHPPTYAEMFEAAGFTRTASMRTFELKKNLVAKIRFKAPGYRIRHFLRDDLENEIGIFHRLQKEIFSGSENYIPRTLNEDRELINKLLPLIDDELILIAEENSGNPVGLMICIPDVYQQYQESVLNRARIISIGILREHRRRALGAMLATHLSSTLIKKGYVSAEASWIYKSNVPPQRLSRLFKGQPAREFGTFEKVLTSA